MRSVDRYHRWFNSTIYAFAVVICVVLSYCAVRDFGKAWGAGVQVVTEARR